MDDNKPSSIDMDVSMSKDSATPLKQADFPQGDDDGGGDSGVTDETWIELRIINRLLNKPKAERNRITSLLNFQHKINEVEHEFHNRLRQLELEFADRYAQVFHERSDIIAGRCEPTPEQIESHMFPDLKYMPVNNEVETAVLSPSSGNVDERGDAGRYRALNQQGTNRGIEGFWLEVLKQSVFVDEIKPQDEDALMYLRDISLTETTDQYTFKFEFDDNPYFCNRILLKKYFLRNVKANTMRLDFQGMEIYRCEGTRIAWKSGKDLAREEHIVKQYNADTNKYRHVKRVEIRDSFFNFFEPIANELSGSTTSTSENQTEIADLLHRDFMLGDYLHDCLVPGAIKLYFGIGVADNDADDVDGLTGEMTKLNVDEDDDEDVDDDEGSSYEYDDDAEQNGADYEDDDDDDSVEAVGYGNSSTANGGRAVDEESAVVAGGKN